jgi:hypothetical protein
MAWRLANSLDQYRTQINWSAPSRSKVSDGTIGDLAHQGTVSDHNPRLIPGLGPIPVVTAIDITNDPKNGLDFNRVAEALRLSRDTRIKYVIWNRRQFSSTVSPWVWRPYSGDNPHDKHGHLSVMSNTSADSMAHWSIGDEDDMDHSLDPMMNTLARRMDAVRGNVEKYTVDYGTGPVQETNVVAVKMNKNEAQLVTLTKMVTDLTALVQSMSTGTGLSVQQVEDAAFRGAQRAEQE